MVTGLLSSYIGLLIFLFIIAIIVIGIAIYRSKDAGKRVFSSTTPIPQATHRNEHTRIDQGPTTVSHTDRNYSEVIPRQDVNENR